MVARTRPGVQNEEEVSGPEVPAALMACDGRIALVAVLLFNKGLESPCCVPGPAVDPGRARRDEPGPSWREDSPVGDVLL